MEIEDFCPVQHPADAADSDTVTTHFEYHCMEDNLLKLDMLGHDDPTIVRMLEDLTGVNARAIPLDDADTMSIFTSSAVLGYENDPILGPTGAVAIPEFNTRFTRQMLEHNGIAHRTGVVVQDPTMQRRTMATFARVWQDDPRAPTWYSAPGCVPVLRNGRDGVTFGGEDTGLWPVGRYLALILGELPRLADNPQGYGPLGKGFIAHVDIPPDIAQAWQTLRDDRLLSDALSARQLA